MDTLLEWVLVEGMDEWLLVDEVWVEDEIALVLHDPVTVTVTVSFGQLPQP